ncbi:MAG: GSCFA domain-containing protein [Candidatus Cryptobacteroides sp.]
MIKLQTPVADRPCKVRIGYENKILFLGSCFSDNVGTILANYGFDVMTNPFGALYNPLSIAQSIERIAEGREFTPEECMEIGAGDARICSHWHHTLQARSTAEEFLRDANEKLHEAHNFLTECDTVIITLGTSQVFDKDGFTVNNCLKRPAHEFVRRRLSTDEISDCLERITGLHDFGTPKRYIFTVSPIRHLADGAHNNQLHKAALLLGIDDMLSSISAENSTAIVQNAKSTLENTVHKSWQSPNSDTEQTLTTIQADYFPAYEIMMDELRDYRFYAEDLCHPSDQAVRYIAERFLDWTLPQEQQPFLADHIRRYKSSCHRSKA